MNSVVSIPRQAAEEAKENPKVAELKDRLIEAYPHLFSGVANKNPPDRAKYAMAKINLRPNRKIIVTGNINSKGNERKRWRSS